VNLQVAQQNQTNHGGPWDYSPSPIWGGHAVLAGLYTSDTVATHSDISVVTWGEVLGTTDTFWARQTQEAWVVLWPEHFGTVAFQQGIDINALAAAYKTLTGRDLPNVPPPHPAPPAPAPDTADQSLVAAVGPWARQRHPWAQNIADAINTWRRAKGL
jgi:hypothetical protein